MTIETCLNYMHLCQNSALPDKTTFQIVAPEKSVEHWKERTGHCLAFSESEQSLEVTVGDLGWNKSIVEWVGDRKKDHHVAAGRNGKRRSLRKEQVAGQECLGLQKGLHSERFAVFRNG